MRTRAWWACLAAGTAAVISFPLLPDNWWQTGMDLGIELAAVAALLAGIALHRPRRPLLWGMLALGLLFVTAGDLVYALYERVLHTAAPFPSLADAAYLAGCPLIGLAMVLLVRARTAGKDRVAWIDAAIVASGFGLLSWVFLMAPTAGSNDLTVAGRLVALAYPVWDVVFLALLVRLLAGIGARLPALRLLAGAVALWLVYDTIYALLVQYGNYDQGQIIDVMWLLGFVLFGAGALHPSMAELTQPVEEQAEQLAQLAQHDGLTGIPNRRAWDGELPVAMDRARRDGVPLSVALLDLDHFKRFNDEHGHQAGDRLLKSATTAWTTALRGTDLLCRYGGEEFAVLLPGADAQQAAEVLERMRAASPQEQTFSAGLACWDRQEISDELVARADRALYAAKASGRDRIVS